MRKNLIVIGCVLIYWGCLIAAAALYGAGAAVIVLAGACAAVGAMMFFGE